MVRREIKIVTPLGTKFVVRKSYDGKEVHVIRFESDDRLTEIMENGTQWYQLQGQIILSVNATGSYGWTLKEVVNHVQENIELNMPRYW